MFVTSIEGPSSIMSSILVKRFSKVIACVRLYTTRNVMMYILSLLIEKILPLWF